MRYNLRVFFVGGYYAYRALFNWMHWSHYVPTMLGGPTFQLLFFAYVGRFAQLQDDEFFVTGNAIHLSAMAGIFGMSMTIGGERWTQTLSPLMATPANRLAMFLGRSLPLILNGVLTSVFVFLVGWALLDFEMPLSGIPALGVVVLASSMACTALGLVVGAVGLRGRDVMFLANIVVYTLLLVCGANVPIESLPGWLQVVASGVPLTHGIEATRAVADGASLAEVDHLVWTELGIGLVYAVVGFSLFRLFELEGRRRATLETM